MSGLQMVDRAEVLVVVDNLTDNLSSVPRNVETEWKRNLRLFSAIWHFQSPRAEHSRVQYR
jgi:hypothetical protein